MRGHSRRGHLPLARAAVAAALALPLPAAAAQTAGEAAVVTLPPELRRGRDLLAAAHFSEARALFTGYLRRHPHDVQAQVGLGDAELGAGELEAAEATYRAAVAEQPQLWQAHKDLVVVEARLGRWEEFDRERTVLRMARERQAPDISRTESDLIDRFEAGGVPWLVRAYFAPVGRSAALYNFEHFTAAGRIQAYISLEDQAAARAALTPGDVHIGPGSLPAVETHGPLALNWYTGTAHGTIRAFPEGAPPYRQLRAEVRRWIARNPEKIAGSAAREAHQTP